MERGGDGGARWREEEMEARGTWHQNPSIGAESCVLILAEGVARVLYFIIRVFNFQ